LGFIFLNVFNWLSPLPIIFRQNKEVSKKTKLPIYALGGLSKEDLSAAEKNGAYGIAGISGF